MPRVLSATSRRRYLSEWGALAVALLLIGALVVYLVLHERQGIGERERERLNSAAQVLDDNIMLQLSAVDAAVRGVRDEVTTAGGAHEAAPVLSRRLRPLTDALPGANGMLVIDARGRVVAAHQADMVGLDMSQRDYFSTPQAHPDRSRLYVTRPFHAISGIWLVNITRVLQGPGGAFGGVVTASLDPDYLAVAMRSVLYAPDMHATLIHGSGMVFLVMPPNPPLMGTDVNRPGTFFTRHRATGQRATLLTGMTLLGEDRMVATRTLERSSVAFDHPFVLHLGRELDALYGPWRRLATSWLSAFALLAVGTSLMLGYSHRRRAEAERRQVLSERRLRAITDALPALISQLDCEERYVFANAHFAATYRVDHRSLVGKTLREQLGDSTYAQLQPHVKAVLDGEPRSFEYVASIDGEQRHFQQSVVPDLASDGAVQGFYAVSFDITDRKRAELLRARSEARMRSILARAPDAFIAIDAHGCVTDWNEQAEATFGWQRDEVLGSTLSELIIPAQLRSAHEAGLEHFVATGAGPVLNRRIEIGARRRDGSELPVELSVGSLREGGAHVAFAFLHDISLRKQAEARMAVGEQRIRTIADNLPVLISYIDSARHLQFCNETLRAWIGIDPAAATGKALVQVIGPALYEQWRDALERALAGERVEFEIETELLGVRRAVQNIVIPDVAPDGRVAGVYALSTDITAVKRVQQQLNEMARVDSLTGLPNRRLFEERLPMAIARTRRDARPMALLLLDVDHFKDINDNHGHGTGDAVLQELARRLRKCVRATDTVVRLAGDEFVLILEALRGLHEAELVARKIGKALEPPFDVGGGLKLEVTASIGVALLEGATPAPHELLARADKALYAAKRAGRNTFETEA